MVRGTVRVFDSGVTGSDVSGSSNSESAQVGSLFSTIIAMNGIDAVSRKTETIVVYLNVWLRIDGMAYQDSNLLKSVHPIHVGASLASA